MNARWHSHLLKVQYILSDEASLFVCFLLCVFCVCVCSMPVIIFVISGNCQLTGTAIDQIWMKLLIKLNIFPLISLLSNLVKYSWHQTILKNYLF